MPALTLRKSLHRFLNTIWLHDYRLYALWVFMPFGFDRAGSVRAFGSSNPENFAHVQNEDQ